MGHSDGSAGDTLSVAVLANTQNYFITDRRDVRFESDKDVTKGLNEMISTARWGFAEIEAGSSTEAPVVVIKNID